MTTTEEEIAETTPPTILVRVQEQPAAEPGAILCRAVQVAAPTVAEGAAVALGEVGTPFPVALGGASPPHAGQYVVAEHIGGSWTIPPRGRGA
jgi:hypothetical protein